MPNLHVFKNEKETCQAFAEWFANRVKEIGEKKGTYSLALGGGHLPKTLYKILAEEYREKIDWSRLKIFLVAEKCMSGAKNNTHEGMYFLDHLPIAAEQFYPVNTQLAPGDAARAYEVVIKQATTTNESFDLVLLSPDERGEIFFAAGKKEENGAEQWVLPVLNSKEDVFTICLTADGINAAGAKAFIVTGKSHQDTVLQILKGKYDPEKYPTQLIQTANKTVHWFLDEAAAEKLIKLSS